MNKEKTPINHASGDRTLESSFDIHPLKSQTSDNETVKDHNNANITRTNLDTELIDINSDGDSDESKYTDII